MPLTIDGRRLRRTDKVRRPRAAPAGSAFLILGLENQRAKRRQHQLDRLVEAMYWNVLRIDRARIPHIAAAVNFCIGVEQFPPAVSPRYTHPVIGARNRR